MTNDALLWNAPKPPPRKPRPSEHIWSMRKNEKQVDAELRTHGESGCECQFLYNGEFAYGRLWALRAEALAEAEDKQQELQQKGWELVSTETSNDATTA